MQGRSAPETLQTLPEATLDNKLEVPPTSTVKYNRSKGFIFTKKAWQEQHKTLQKKHTAH